MYADAAHQFDVLAAELFLLVVEGEAGPDVVVPREEDGEEEDEVRHHRQEAGGHEACMERKISPRLRELAKWP